MTLADELQQHHDEVDDVEMERQGNHQCFFVDPIYQRGWSVVLGSSSSPPAPPKRLVDPQHPLLSDKELIVEVLRQNPGLTVEEILAEAKFHGWDLDPTGVQLPLNTNPAKPSE